MARGREEVAMVWGSEEVAMVRGREEVAMVRGSNLRAGKGVSLVYTLTWYKSD